jgi:hypothetical protein
MRFNVGTAESLQLIQCYIITHRIYRLFHDFRAELQEVISYVFVIKKVHINILDCYRVMTASSFRTRPRVNRVCHHAYSLSPRWKVSEGGAGRGEWLGMSNGYIS